MSEGGAPEHDGGAAIVVVGSLNLDHVVRTPRLPAAGETVAGHALAQAHGGKGGNQAVAAARLGARVAFIGCVGDDAHGAVLMDELAREGIDVRGVTVVPGAVSGTALVMVADDGANSIVVVAGANKVLAAAHADAEAQRLRQARVVVAQLEVPLVAVHAALAHARAGGATAVLNAAPAQPLDDDLLRLVDWLVVNESEAAALAGHPVRTPPQAMDAAQRLRWRGAGRVVVTLGAEGAVVADGCGARHHAATPVAAIDTTGAGDTFTGALAAALAEGAAPDDAVRHGQRAAAWSVARAGVRASMPQRSDLTR